MVSNRDIPLPYGRRVKSNNTIRHTERQFAPKLDDDATQTLTVICTESQRPYSRIFFGQVPVFAVVWFNLTRFRAEAGT